MALQQGCQHGNVIVTGASSGIGRATALRFARAGWNVCLIARRAALLAALHEQLPAGAHLVCPASVDDAAQLAEVATQLRARWGEVHALVHSAAVFQRTHCLDTPLAEWRAYFLSLVEGALNATRLAVPLMRQGGRVIFISSIHGARAEAGSSAYSAAKAALNQLCRALAVELAPHILVNAIAPGFIDTPMSVVDGVNELTSDWFAQHYLAGHHLPLKRAGRPEEIAGVALFLAGPDASYLTGQVIAVDGGLSVTF
jgi:3-oxoacyl-[acyl-carrier protein] reductase